MPSVTLNAREVQTTLADLGITIQCKAAPATAAPAQTVKIDVDEGIVTAIVSVTGVEDDVADIILPGAYSETLTKRTPKVCWHHQWEDPIGRTLHIEEWAPGDKRLPKHTKDGKPWPKDAGALVATMQFNMKSKRGAEAFEAVRFYTESNECEWSIGYKVHPGKSVRDKQGRRLIKAVDLYELSFVLFGAAPLSMTLSLKAAVDAWQTKASAVDIETKGTSSAGQTEAERAASAEAVEKMLHDLALVEIDWDEVAAVAAIDHVVDMDAIAAQPDWRPEVDRQSSLAGMVEAAKSGEAMPDGSYPIQSERDLRAAIRYVEAKDVSDQVLQHVMQRAIVLGRKDLILGTPLESKEGGADRNRGGAEKLRRWYTHGEGAAKIRWGTPGDFMRCVRIAGKHMRPDQAKGYCQLRHMEATGEPAGPGAHGGKKKKGKSAAPVAGKSAETAIGTGAMVALRLPAPVASQIAHRDGNPPDELHVTLAFLGDASEYDDETKAAVLSAVQRVVGAAPALSGTIGGIAQFPAGPDGRVPTWVPVDVPGLEEFREQVVDAVEEAGATVSRSHGYTPHITLGYDLPPRSPVPSTEVTLDTVRVVFGGDDTPVTMGAALSGYDPAMEDPAMNQTKRLSDSVRLSNGSFDAPSYEDRVEAVNVAARAAFGDERDDGAAVEIRSWVYVRGTWPDKVILTIEKHGTGERETLQVPYTVSDDGEVEFGEPRKVRLVVEVEDDEDEGSLAEDLIEDAARYLATDVVEGKAGRVLSTVNTERLRAAVRNLVTVLAAAGVEILTPTDEDVAAERETGRDAPAPSAPSSHKIESTSAGLNAKSVVIDKAQHEALMARLGLA